MTKDYLDLQAKKAALEAELARLHDLYSLAQTIEELTMISTQINKIQTDLNKTNFSIMNYDLLVALSTVHVTIFEREAPLPSTFPRRFGEVMNNLGIVLLGLLEFLLYAVICITPFAIIFLPVIYFGMKYFKKQNEKYRMRQEEMMRRRQNNQNNPNNNELPK